MDPHPKDSKRTPENIEKHFSEGNLPWKPDPCKVGTIYVDRLSFPEMLQWIVGAIKAHKVGRPLRIVGSNAQIVSLAKQNLKLRSAMNLADLSLADGMSVVIASRLLGKPIKGRIPCGEMMVSLCAVAARDGFRVYLLGGLPMAAEKTANLLQRRYPDIVIAGTYCPPAGFEKDIEEMRRIREILTKTAPDFLFIAFGAPKQEIWMYENYLDLPVRVILPVGGAFDTHAGLRKRAPEWTHHICLEWFYRLLMEPRRLWYRYSIGNLEFLWIVISQFVQSRRKVAEKVRG